MPNINAFTGQENIDINLNVLTIEIILIFKLELNRIFYFF